MNESVTLEWKQKEEKNKKKRRLAMHILSWTQKKIILNSIAG